MANKKQEFEEDLKELQKIVEELAGGKRLHWANRLKIRRRSEARAILLRDIGVCPA